MPFSTTIKKLRVQLHNHNHDLKPLLYTEIAGVFFFFLGLKIAGFYHKDICMTPKEMLQVVKGQLMTTMKS